MDRMWSTIQAWWATLVLRQEDCESEPGLTCILKPRLKQNRIVIYPCWMLLTVKRSLVLIYTVNLAVVIQSEESQSWMEPEMKYTGNLYEQEVAEWLPGEGRKPLESTGLLCYNEPFWNCLCDTSDIKGTLKTVGYILYKRHCPGHEFYIDKT